ncbi:transcription factor ssl1, partial [Opisthorchis viverrini]
NAIREDDAGRLVTTLEQLVHDAHSQLRKKRHRAAVGTEGFVRLGMMRHLFLIIDMSSAMQVQDLKPTRLVCTLRAVAEFVRDYFDQNPISQLGIIVTADRQAERLTELSGNPRCHLAALETLFTRPCSGEPSLQNALTLAESRLKYTPHHSEILVIMASLTTCDPGDIHKTIQSLAANHIRCSVVSLAVEVFVFRALAQITQGQFHVILDEPHLKTVLKNFVPPPAATHFPTQKPYCELPVECSVCGLTLVAAPHLARAYHHLFPLDAFTPISPAELRQTNPDQVPRTETGIITCAGCDVVLPEYLTVSHSCDMHVVQHSSPLEAGPISAPSVMDFSVIRVTPSFTIVYIRVQHVYCVFLSGLYPPSVVHNLPSSGLTVF